MHSRPKSTTSAETLNFPPLVGGCNIHMYVDMFYIAPTLYTDVMVEKNI